MKTLLTLLFILPLFCFSQTETYTLKKATAEVEQIFGVYVFINSTPQKPYIILGKEFIYPMIAQFDFPEQRDDAIRKMKKKYPAAEGVVLIFQTPNIQTDYHIIATAIKWEQ